jgi:hypothetical protein
MSRLLLVPRSRDVELTSTNAYVFMTYTMLLLLLYFQTLLFIHVFDIPQEPVDMGPFYKCSIQYSLALRVGINFPVQIAT